MAIKLACADFTWPLLSHHHTLQMIQMLGFEGVDIGLFGNRSHIRPEVVRQDVPMWAGIIGERLDRYGLEPADIFLIASTEADRAAANDPDPVHQEEYRALFHAALEFTRRLGGRGMTVTGGIVFDGETPESSLRNTSEALKWRVDEAAKHDIQLSFEPGAGSNTDTPAKVLRLLELTPGLTLTLDYGHFVYVGIPDAEIEPLIEHARHFHCRGAAKNRMQTRFHENAIDFRRVLERMQEVGYPGYFAIEYVWIDLWDCNRVDNTMETIQFRDFARAVLEGREYVPHQPNI